MCDLMSKDGLLGLMGTTCYLSKTVIFYNILMILINTREIDTLLLPIIEREVEISTTINSYHWCIYSTLRDCGFNH